MKQKVLFVASVQVHIEAFHLPYLQYFSVQGYEVHVAANGEGNIPFCDHFHPLPFARSPLSSTNRLAYAQLKRLIENENYTLIHCHTPVGGALTRLAASKARKSGTKVIYTAHGFHFFKGAPFKNWLIFYPVEKWLARKCDALITINSEDYAFAKKKMAAKHIYYVHGVGLDTDRFPEKSEKDISHTRHKLGLNESDYACIFVAELNKNKNQALLIETLALLHKNQYNIELFLAGEGPCKENCEMLAKERGIAEHVHFLGYRKDIAELLPACDLYFASSHREGLPVNVMEALCCDLPVIATDIRGHRDLVQNGKNGFLVKANSPAHFAEAIKSVLDDPALTSYMRENARKSLRPFTLNKVKEEMISIYETILGE